MKDKRFIALGDLIADCYYDGTNLINATGGGSKYNVLANLSAKGYSTAAIGACGNDLLGNIIINELNNVGVNTSNIFQTKDKTRSFNLSIINEKFPIKSYSCSKQSPIDGSNTWYENSIDELNYMKNFIHDNDVIIIDEVDNFTIETLTNLENDFIMDIGNINYLKNLSVEEIYSLQNKMEMIQLNERVANYLIKKFHFHNLNELYNLLHPKLLIITYGNQGAIFINNNEIIKKKLTNATKEIDPTGAGDAFLSVLTAYYYEMDKNTNHYFIDKAFKLATSLTSNVVQYQGARGHLYHELEKPNKTTRDNKSKVLVKSL